VPAMAWPAALLYVRDMLTRLTGYYFNFVLVNRLVLQFYEVLWYNYPISCVISHLYRGSSVIGIEMERIILLNIEMMRGILIPRCL
jgi:hypothetical protein